MRETENHWPVPINIVGPCAAEALEGVLLAGQNSRKRNLDYVRACLFKPRTQPGWDGVGAEVGAEWLVESMIANGIIPCTEVGNGFDADVILNVIDRRISSKESKKVLFWVGSRNQYHPNQQSIGRAVAGVDWVKVGIKNPMGEDEAHWKGIVEHLMHGGAKKEQLFMIHRGFKPSRDGLRNPPNWETMVRIKEATGLPMVVDTSHMGGTRGKVIAMTQWVLKEAISGGMDIDGIMLEVHDFLTTPKTDAGQQLLWSEYDDHIHLLLQRWVSVYQQRNYQSSPLLLPV